MERVVSGAAQRPLTVTVEGERRPLAAAAEFSLRLLIIAAAIAVIALVVAQLRLVVLPVLLALFLATALTPPTRWLEGHGLPRSMAALVSMASAGAILAAILATIVPAVAGEVDDLGRSAREGIDQVLGWLTSGPLGLTERDIERAVDRAVEQAGDRSNMIAGGVLSGVIIAAEIVAGLLLAGVLLFFFLRDGDSIWAWVVGLLPARHREDVRVIGSRVWRTLGRYLGGVSLVATVDALLIGAALVLIGVPLVLPLVVLTFLGAFVPLVGAVTAGAVAALVALVSEGVVAAVMVIVAITVIQQLEGDLIYPLVVGKAISLHPVAVLLALTMGVIVAGLIGALLAVPTAAALWQTIRYYRDKSQKGGRIVVN